MAELYRSPWISRPAAAPALPRQGGAASQRNGYAMTKPKLLIVEDDEGLCSQYRWAFPACELVIAHARPQAHRARRRRSARRSRSSISACRPIRTASAKASRHWRRCCARCRDIKVIVATGNGDRMHALRGDRQRRLRFLRKADGDRRAAHHRRSRAAPARAGGGEPPPAPSAPARSPIKRIITAAEAMLKVCRDVEKLATTNVSGAAAGRERHRQGGAGAARCTSSARAPSSRSSPSIAAPSPRTCWKASCSATSAAPSPAR